MKPYVSEQREVICFSISSGMSTSGNVMRLAAEELEASDLVTVIDSANLSTGIGLLVIEAAIMAQEGKTAGEITAVIEELKPKVRASFVVDTLVYLYRGGRCNAVSAMAGSVLKLHPKIVVENGAMDASKKYRGKLSKVITAYVKDLEEELKAAVLTASLLHIPAVTEKLWKQYAHILKILKFLKKSLKHVQAELFPAIADLVLWACCLFRNRVKA